MDIITNFVQAHTLGVSATILIIAYIIIATEKIPKATVALLGATIAILFGLVRQEPKINDAFNESYFINYIDWNVIFLLVSMMIIVNIAAKSGVFNWIANNTLIKTKGKHCCIFVALAPFTAVLSAFLDNVTTVILVMPVTFYIAKQLDINPIPFLLMKVFASNIGGTATLIGDPPNIIIGSAAKLSFMDFVKELTIGVSIILAVVTAVLLAFFKKDLKTTEEKMQLVTQLDNSKTITNKALMIRSVLVLALVILGFITHDKTHIPTSIIAMAGASFLLLFEKPTELLEKVEWNTIFFFIGLFVIIGAFEASGCIALMAEWILKVTKGSQEATGMLILWASGFISGVIDNIPYTATMTPMLLEIQARMGEEYVYPLWWCLSLGACLSGNMTIIGAAANVIVSEMSASKGYPIAFMRFLKYGVITMLISLAISTVYIWIKYF